MTTSVPATSGFLLLGIDLEGLDAAHARRAHAAGDDGRMAGLAAMGSQNALGGDHAGEVVGVGLPTDEHALAARGLGGHGVGGGESRFAHGAPGLCVQAAREHVVFGEEFIELRVQELVELLGVDAADGLFLGDQALLHHFDGDVQRGGSGALAHAGLRASTACPARW